MAPIRPERSVQGVTGAAASLCPRCGLLLVEVHDAQGRHAWRQCVYCYDVPHVPLDWGVHWSTVPDSSTARHGETRR